MRLLGDSWEPPGNPPGGLSGSVPGGLQSLAFSRPAVAIFDKDLSLNRLENTFQEASQEALKSLPEVSGEAFREASWDSPGRLQGASWEACRSVLGATRDLKMTVTSAWCRTLASLWPGASWKASWGTLELLPGASQELQESHFRVQPLPFLHHN